MNTEPESAERGDTERAEAKSRLRTELRRRLEALPPEEARAASEEIAERALALPEIAGAGGVLTCLSFGTEVDTWGLVGRLLEAGKRVYAPRSHREGLRLSVHRYPCPLRTLSFGLKEPARGVPEVPADHLAEEIDAALILGLGFDRRGYRLGYGAGYFDRFLAGKTFPAVGLAFDLQVVDRLPTEPHDVPMRVVLTESGEYRA